MGEAVKVTGIVLSSFPIGENDRRLTVLTKERGKLPLFARGCRKPTHPLFSVTQPLRYCEYMITEGRTLNFLDSGECKDSFPKLRDALDRIYYASYFAEAAEYFTVEGQDERNILNLLFVTLKAAERGLIPLPLIRSIYELKLLQYYGAGLGVHACVSCGSPENLRFLSLSRGGVLCEDCAGKLEAAEAGESRPVEETLLYALQYALGVPPGELYSFRLSPGVQTQFQRVARRFFTRHVNHRFRSAKAIEAWENA